MKALGLDVGGTRIKSYLVDIEDIKDTSKYKILSSETNHITYMNNLLGSI